jgi:hypothetical protein
VTRSMQTSAPGHPEFALTKDPTAVASATSAAHAPVPVSSSMEDGRHPVLPLEAHLPESAFLLTRLRDIELMSIEVQSYHVALDARVSELELQMSDLTRERDDLMMEIRALRAEFKKVRLQKEPKDDVPTGDPKGRRNVVRLGKRDNKGREDSDPSLKESEEENFSNSDSESSGDSAADRAQGPPVPGLNEIIPSRSAYRQVLSYRTYRLVNKNQRYEPSVTAKLASYAKRIKHSLEETFDGNKPIAVLDFLRSFKESADHNQVGEGAATRLMPYFLKGAAKEEYRSYLKEVPASKPLYPNMVQYLLETYASDDELAKAYHMAVTARQRENEDDRAFALRIRQIAASAGNVFDEATLKSILVGGLAEYVQDSLRVHVTPEMPFSKVQRVAHQLFKSLRRISERSQSVGGSKKKEEHVSVRAGRTSAFAVEEDGDESIISEHLATAGGCNHMEAALMAEGTRYPYGFNRIRSTPSQSTDGSVFSVPTRGWESPSDSVISAPIGGSRIPRGIPRQNLCFMCYRQGHVISAHNRALYYNISPTPQVVLKNTSASGLGTTPIARKSYMVAVGITPPSEVAVIEEDPPDFPAAEDPVARQFTMEMNKADSKNPQGGM